MGWPIVMMPQSYVQWVITPQIADPAGGVLDFYVVTAMGAAALQGEDSLYIDGGPDLVPGDAVDATGMTIFDGNSPEGEQYGIWQVDEPIPGGDQVIELLYHDASNNRSYLLYVPIPSWEVGVDEYYRATVAITVPN